MKKYSVLFAILLAVFLMTPIQAEACSKCQSNQGQTQKCKIGKLKKKVKMLYMHKDYLKITDDQMSKIKDIKHNALKELIQLKADKDIVMVDLKSAMWSDDINVKSVNSLIDKKYASKISTAKTYVKAVADIQKVFNKDQRAQVKEMMIKSKLSKGKSGKGCEYCKKSVCPYSGKSYGEKGSSKGSSKGSY